MVDSLKYEKRKFKEWKFYILIKLRIRKSHCCTSFTYYIEFIDYQHYFVSPVNIAASSVWIGSGIVNIEYMDEERHDGNTNMLRIEAWCILFYKKSFCSYETQTHTYKNSEKLNTVNLVTRIYWRRITGVENGFFLKMSVPIMFDQKYAKITTHKELVRTVEKTLVSILIHHCLSLTVPWVCQAARIMFIECRRIYRILRLGTKLFWSPTQMFLWFHLNLWVEYVGRTSKQVGAQINECILPRLRKNK